MGLNYTQLARIQKEVQLGLKPKQADSKAEAEFRQKITAEGKDPKNKGIMWQMPNDFEWGDVPDNKNLPPEEPAKKKSLKKSDDRQDGKPAPEAMKAKGDEGLPTQFEEGESVQSDYLLPGKKVTPEIVAQYLDEFEPDLKEVQEASNQLIKLTGAHAFACRMKAQVSLLKKMNDPLKNRSLNTVTDIIGCRVITVDLNALKRSVNYMRAHFNIVELDDFTEKGQSDTGYRAVHILFRTESGKISECQVRTVNQHVWASYFYDAMFKKKDGDVAKNALVKSFMKETSEYLTRMDKGEGESEKELGPYPKTPPALTKANGEFPWDKIESKQLGEWVSKAEKGKESKRGQEDDESENSQKPVKQSWFVIGRKGSKVVSCEEFVTLQQAKSTRTTLEVTNQDVDYPIAFARDQEELDAVFPEYTMITKKSEAGEFMRHRPLFVFKRYVPMTVRHVF